MKFFGSMAQYFRFIFIFHFGKEEEVLKKMKEKTNIHNTVCVKNENENIFIFILLLEEYRSRISDQWQFFVLFSYVISSLLLVCV